MSKQKNIFLAIAAIIIMAVGFNSCKKDKIPVITIIRQPADSTVVTEGIISEKISLSASATEKATLSYQWYSNTTNSNTGGTAISDATSTNFTIPTTLTEGIYFYFCELSTTDGLTPIRSTVATVIVADEGSPSNPYIVNSMETLQKVGSGDNGWSLDKHYKQTDNIIIIFSETDTANTDTITEPKVWAPIGTSTTHFTGSYNGGGYSIIDLNISTTTNTHGLFGYIGSGGVVKNVALVDVNINSVGSYIGGIAAYNSGIIENCYVTGTVSGHSTVGGITGYNVNGGEIKNCYTTCIVTGNNIYVGGIAGYNAGTVINCYATGHITGANSVGGIVGVNVNPSASVQLCVALNAEVSATIDNTNVGRVAGSVSNGGKLIQNYARETGMTLKNDSGLITPTPDMAGNDGADVPAASTHGANSVTFWSASFNTNLWSLAYNSLPHLKTAAGNAFNQAQTPTVVN